ncbi:MAG: thioredoxin family protein [Oscillospiraceae bacterium]|nr:thioredoxin family protein [Oscillospiraceae bacterium]
MKEVLMFYLEDCGYCHKAARALDELFEAEPRYRQIPLTRIEESRQPELADRFDYYAVPTFYVDGQKIFEARLFMGYDEIRAGAKAALDAALAD